MRVKFDTIISLCLLALSAIIFCNLNGVITLVFGIKAPLSEIMLLLSGIIIYISWFTKKNTINSWWYVTLMIFYISYLYLGTVSLLWDSTDLHTNTSVKDLYRIYLPSIIIITAYYLGFSNILQSNNNFDVIHYLLPFFTITILIVVLGSYLGLYDMYSYSKKALGVERQSGFFGNPNEAGAFANYALVLFLSAILVVKRKLLIIPLILLSVYAALISFSKAAFLLTVLIIFLFLLKSTLNIRTNSLKSNLYIGAFFVVIFFSIQYAIVNFSEIVGDLKGGQQKRVLAVYELLQGKINEKTTSERSVVYEHGIEKIKENPIFGNGLGSFHRFNSGKLQFGVHNTFLLILGESGIIPFLIFSFYFTALGFHGMKVPTTALGFFITGVVAVYLLNICGTGHNALDDRTSNALTGIIIAMINRR